MILLYIYTLYNIPERILQYGENNKYDQIYQVLTTTFIYYTVSTVTRSTHNLHMCITTVFIIHVDWKTYSTYYLQ